jgi:hypothetical protein
MAETEQGARHQPRRFITRYDVEDAAAAGQAVRVRGRDVLTDAAAQRARDLGVLVEREPKPGRGSGSPAPGSAATAPPSPAREASVDDLRRAVRAAVVAELGSEPPELDAVIDRVLAARGR